MKHSIYLCSILSIIGLSCSTKQAQEITIELGADAKCIEGTAQTVNIDMLRPARLYPANNKVIVFDDVSDNIFKVFNLPDLNLAYTFGKIGGGPGEFQMVDKECINIASDNIEIVHHNEIMNFSIGDSTFSFIEPDDASKALILTDASPLNNVKKITEHSYVYNNNDLAGDFELYLYDVNLGKESATGQLSEAEKQILDQEKYPYFSKSICSNLDAKHFATFYHTRPVFKIYNQNGVLLKEVTIIHPDTSSDDPTKLYFTDAFTTDKHIYAMWIGKNKNEIGRDLNAFRPEIMIFD